MRHKQIKTITCAIDALLEDYLNRHSKVLVVRFDVRYPEDFSRVAGNGDISACIAYVVKKYKRQGLDPSYIWVREQHRSIHPHYHCALFLNGQKVRGYRHVFQNVEGAWGRTLGCSISGCINYCLSDDDPDYNGKMVRRDAGPVIFDIRRNEVLQQLSYLAKAYTKELSYDGLRNFGCSSIQNG
jgi:hypothetical protein